MAGKSKKEQEDAFSRPLNPKANGLLRMKETAEAFCERRLGKGKPELSTGLKALDRAIIGIRPKLYVIAGRPAMGKSAFMGGIRRSTISQGKRFITVSLEMDATELCEREIAYQANMNLRRVMSAKEATDEEAKRVIEACSSKQLEQWRIYDDVFSMDDIEAVCLQEKEAAEKDGQEIGGVEIDYLQLMGDVGAEGRTQSVSACSRRTKVLQKKMGCAVWLLSQLNRGVEYRDDKRPLMSDLRESGSIEQDADMVGFLYRESYYNPVADPMAAELIIRKQRSGPVGTVHLQYDGRTVTYSDPPAPINTQPTGGLN